MRFITEFKLEEAGEEKVIATFKASGQFSIGNMIAESFEWKMNRFGTRHPEPVVGERYTLEIEAFPMDKWVEFKQNLFSKFIDDDYENAEQVLQLIKDLESFGKPAGEAKKSTI